MVIGAAKVLIFAALALAAHSVKKRSVTTPQPLSIAPSEYWDGNDGQWSSFGLLLGTPAQQVRVFFASDENAVWAILPEGCTAFTEPTVCHIARGSVFEPSNSTSFLRIGEYWGLLYQGAAALGYSSNAEVGQDSVTLGWSAAGAPELDTQIIESFAGNFPWLGVLGLNPARINLSSTADQYSSIILTLRQQNIIPSLSWAYTAGAVYAQPSPVYGSLTIGGYDANRRGTQGIDIPFDTVLRVAIKSISANSTSLLPNGISAQIDTLVTTMWLPVEACQAFETAFGLTWNETAQLYLLDDDTHARLVAQNPEVVFTIAPTLSNDTTVEIRLPYKSFDLEVSTPLVSQPSRYFPLQRAQNASQYTLGRVFMQEAYLVTDYERSIISLSQTVFPSSGVGASLVAIQSPNTQSPTHHSTSIGLIVGATIGGVAVLAALGAIFWFCSKKRSKTAKSANEPAFDQNHQMPVELNDEKAEMTHEMQESDLPGYHAPHAELPGSPGFRPGSASPYPPGSPGLMPGSPGLRPGSPGMPPGSPGFRPGSPGSMPRSPASPDPFGMSGTHLAPVELEARSSAVELPASVLH